MHSCALRGSAGWWFLDLGTAWLAFRPENDNDSPCTMHGENQQEKVPIGKNEPSKKPNHP